MRTTSAAMSGVVGGRRAFEPSYFCATSVRYQRRRRRLRGTMGRFHRQIVDRVFAQSHCGVAQEILRLVTLTFVVHYQKVIVVTAARNKSTAGQNISLGRKLS